MRGRWSSLPHHQRLDPRYEWPEPVRRAVARRTCVDRRLDAAGSPRTTSSRLARKGEVAFDFPRADVDGEWFRVPVRVSDPEKYAIVTPVNADSVECQPLGHPGGGRDLNYHNVVRPVPADQMVQISRIGLPIVEE